VHTDLGITWASLSKVKTKENTTDIKGQCSSKLSVDSPWLIHTQHQLIIKMCLLRRLSIVKIFLRVAVHTKNATFRGTSAIQIPFHRKEKLVILLRAV